jgi:Zn-dependent protease
LLALVSQHGQIVTGVEVDLLVAVTSVAVTLAVIPARLARVSPVAGQVLAAEVSADQMGCSSSITTVDLALLR